MTSETTMADPLVIAANPTAPNIIIQGTRMRHSSRA